MDFKTQGLKFLAPVSFCIELRLLSIEVPTLRSEFLTRVILLFRVEQGPLGNETDHESKPMDWGWRRNHGRLKLGGVFHSLAM